MSIPPRQRIVIDLDQQPGSKRKSRPYQAFGQAAPKRPRRWPKILGVFAVTLFVLLLVAGAGGYFWWRHYQTTPVYSLALLVDGAQRNDLTVFDRLTDTDKIVSDLASQMVDKVAGKLGFVLGAGILTQANVIPQSVMQTLKQTVKERLAAEVKDFSAQSAPKPFIVLALTLPTVVKVTTENNVARLTTTTKGQTVELTMQRDGEVWKLVGVKDDTFVTRLVSELVTNPPAVDKVKGVEPGKSPRKRRR
ncbi:MAG TPA: hypothetical protein VE135_29425 [Pyrinomonadaceae bacterium]|nr:hypothetical protein [Pyrinomonadaceae bacterium]